MAVDRTFGSNADTPAAGLDLYRFSAGHGGLKCEVCHGSTHAEFPAAHRNDNIQSIQHQGHEGTLAECLACHPSQPNTVSGGPHGIKLVLSGRLTLPNPVLDPPATGFRFQVSGAGGGLLFERAVPPGAADEPRAPGWRTNSAGTRWAFRDRGGSVAGGVTSVVIQRSRATSSQFTIRLRAPRVIISTVTSGETRCFCRWAGAHRVTRESHTPSLGALRAVGVAMTGTDLIHTHRERAVDRDPRLRRRLLREFDRGASMLRGFLVDRFGGEDLDKVGC